MALILLLLFFVDCNLNRDNKYVNINFWACVNFMYMIRVWMFGFFWNTYEVENLLLHERKYYELMKESYAKICVEQLCKCKGLKWGRAFEHI